MVPTKSPTAICPQTRLTVPECSCNRCFEEQIRRFMPALLERDGRDSLRGGSRASPDSGRAERLAA